MKADYRYDALVDLRILDALEQILQLAKLVIYLYPYRLKS